MAFTASRLRSACLLACLLAPSAAAQLASEEELKAAVLFNLLKFVQWPEETLATSETLDLCVVGDQAFAKRLVRTIGKRHVHGKPVRILETAPGQDVPACHAIFLPARQEQFLPAILKREESNTLLMSDVEDFAEKGGTVGLVRIRSRIRFEINNAAARRADLKLSSRLLRLARIVEETRSPDAPRPQPPSPPDPSTPDEKSPPARPLPAHQEKRKRTP